jgi:hypothetical protein
MRTRWRAQSGKDLPNEAFMVGVAGDSVDGPPATAVNGPFTDHCNPSMVCLQSLGETPRCFPASWTFDGGSCHVPNRKFNIRACDASWFLFATAPTFPWEGCNAEWEGPRAPDVRLSVTYVGPPGSLPPLISAQPKGLELTDGRSHRSCWVPHILRIHFI